MSSDQRGVDKEVEVTQIANDTPLGRADGTTTILLKFVNGPCALTRISFTNNATAKLTVKAKINDEPWRILLDQVTLMADPHYVDGSQDRFTFRCPSTLSNAPLVEELEFVLQQPSPHWHKFGLNKLKCFTTDLEPGKVTKKEDDIFNRACSMTNSVSYFSELMKPYEETDFDLEELIVD
eukprot:m.68918 g.68918  ORF g.68918 m.68918 type:complete len:180 (+) comp12011_c0_seq2:267-806(+)